VTLDLTKTFADPTVTPGGDDSSFKIEVTNTAASAQPMTSPSPTQSTAA
jgi:hypothetical protein